MKKDIFEKREEQTTRIRETEPSLNIDRVVFDLLVLTEQKVYRAVVELVKNRLVKARSI